MNSDFYNVPLVLFCFRLHGYLLQARKIRAFCNPKKLSEAGKQTVVVATGFSEALTLTTALYC